MESVEERKQKFRLVAPLIVLPFVALLFYSLGGGRADVQQAHVDTTLGLNSNLPSPQLVGDGNMDKLSLYRKEEKEHQDSIMFHRGRNDTVFIPSLETDGVVSAPFSAGLTPAQNKTSGNSALAGDYRPPHQTTEDKLAQKVAALQDLLAKHAADTLAPPPTALPKQDSASEGRIAALEAMLQQQTPEATGDGAAGGSDLAQMEAVLGKVLDIQHPELVQERLRKASTEQKGKVLAVVAQPAPVVSDLIQTPANSHPATVSAIAAAQTGQFFELDDQVAEPATTNTISAVIHEAKTVSSGATIKIRLQQDVYIQGQLIPKGTFVYGKCSFSGDRLLVNISAITYQGNFYPVTLTVYDSGGMAGIPVDESLNQDAAKDGSQQAIQALSVGSMDPSLGAQAASAGIEAAKHLLTKKVKAIKVTLKADYPILLVSNTNL